ncbi:hypothetical protein F891_03043 [Acinetobacter sp. CIP 101966]|uniref:hypothetical protein n=1 Tax=Acinetobacter TaxID=469 RepID=UPI0002CD8BCC|nr:MULTISPECIES: hypothetical protein [Acinetobacter]ENX25914.1 hypothetical protein F891_03043 [Acinetobacter sp. CIP 101966]MCT8090860.1 hypothetical protein [Acinetobacter sp. F_3_1]MCT8099332.1 hypothetical protein [Acinetobacter sp. C_3_1]MCT8102300.1 hypothetical protein [Acinetobacter sp. C_4_1]MCT8136098.1 hypothetical protein [Acinetobacter sp. T_3_1]
MSKKVFEDSDKKIILPADIKFDNGLVVPIEEVSVNTVRDDDNNIIALDLNTDYDGPTMTNHIVFDIYGQPDTGIGLYDEDPDDYEHPDDRSYDVAEDISQETLDEIQIQIK